MSTKPSQRKIQVILPDFQLRLVTKFIGLSMVAMLVQFLFMGILLTNALGEVPGSKELMPEVPAIVFKTVLFMAVLQLPILFAGLILTLRVAGPIYRFESYLRALARGDHGGPCNIRDKDEFGSLNEAINEVACSMDQLRASQGSAGSEVRKAG